MRILIDACSHAYARMHARAQGKYKRLAMVAYFSPTEKTAAMLSSGDTSHPFTGLLATFLAAEPEVSISLVWAYVRVLKRARARTRTHVRTPTHTNATDTHTRAHTHTHTRTCTLVKVKNGIFKMIPKISEGSWLTKKAVGETPVIIGRKLETVYHRCGVHVREFASACACAEIRKCLGEAARQLLCLLTAHTYTHAHAHTRARVHTYTHACARAHAHVFRGPGYLEIDVDVSSDPIARRITGMCIGVVSTLVVDLAFLFEGHTEDELPEALLVRARARRRMHARMHTHTHMCMSMHSHTHTHTHICRAASPSGTCP